MERIVNGREELWIGGVIMWEKEKDKNGILLWTHMENKNAITFLCNLFTGLQERPGKIFRPGKFQTLPILHPNTTKVDVECWRITPNQTPP